MSLVDCHRLVASLTLGVYVQLVLLFYYITGLHRRPHIALVSLRPKGDIRPDMFRNFLQPV